MNAPAVAAAPQTENERLPAVAGERPEFQQPTDRMITGWLTPTNLASALQIAEFMAKASLLPQHMQNVGNCLLVLSQAARWGMDPFAVAQATAVVKGKLCFEGKLVAAALAATGACPDLDYEFDGDGQGMSIVVTGTVRRTGKVKKYGGTVEQLRTDNDQWRKDPMSMLAYRATRQWARLYCPEVMLGVVTPDEIEPREVEGEVTGTEKSPAATTPVKAARTRGAKAATEPAAPTEPTPAESAASAPAESAPATTPAAPTPDPRLAVLLNEGKALHESGPMGAASLRAVLNQLAVTKLQNVPIAKLDEAISKVRQEARVCNVTLPVTP